MKQKLLKVLPLLALMINASLSFAQLWTPVFSALDSTAGKKILSTSALRDFSFFNENRGIVSFTNKYHFTTNGGALWSDSGYVQYFALGGLSYIDSQTIFAHSGGRIIKSVNGGGSFSLASTLSSSISNAFIEVKGRFGLVAGQSCGAAYSNNGGTTWTNIPQASLCNSAGGGPSLMHIDIIDSSIAFIGGQSGNIFKTIDGGATWGRVTPPIFGNVSGTDVLGLDFVDTLRGFIIQQSSTGSGGNIVYKTIDGGKTWTVITPPLFSTINGTNLSGNYGAIFAQDSNTIYLGASYGFPSASIIYKSTNGGQSYSIEFTTASNVGVGYAFNKFKKAGNTLFVSTANGGNSTSDVIGGLNLIRIFKRNLLATSIDKEGNKKFINFSIAPNPAANFVMIEGLDSKNISAIAIYSIDGKLIKTIPQSQLSIDIADLNASIYFIKIETKDGQSGVAKFIKQ